MTASASFEGYRTVYSRLLIQGRLAVRRHLDPFAFVLHPGTNFSSVELVGLVSNATDVLLLDDAANVERVEEVDARGRRWLLLQAAGLQCQSC